VNVHASITAPPTITKASKLLAIADEMIEQGKSQRKKK